MTPTCLVVRAGSCDVGDCIHPRGRSRRPMLASTPHNHHWSARFDCQKGYADTPTIRNALSLSIPFHSPAAMEAGWCGLERRPPVQGWSELQAHDATVLQSLAVEVREGLGRSPGLCHTSSASLLGAHKDSGQLPCAVPRRSFRRRVGCGREPCRNRWQARACRTVLSPASRRRIEPRWAPTSLRTDDHC